MKVHPVRRRVAFAVALALAALVGTLGPAAPATAQPALATNVFDPNQVGWANTTDLTEAQFQTAFTQWSGDGFLVMDLDVDMTTSGLRLGAVWQKNVDGRGWMVKTTMTLAQYQDIFAQATKDRMRLHDMETYVRNGVRFYAAVWVSNVEGLGFDAQQNLTYDQAVTYYEQQRSRRMPVDVDIYPTSLGTRFGLVWLDNPTNIPWRLHLSLTDSEFGTAFDSYAAAFRMLVVDSDQTSKGQRYAGIWLANPNGRVSVERRDLTAQQYANWWHRYRDLGLREIGYERYETAGGTRFVTLWRQNSERPAWPLKELVDNRVAEELDGYGVPGISVAVIQNGQTMYLRGFGQADVAADVWLDSDHVLRTASVSKAFAGVLTMKLHEMGEIGSLVDPTGSYLPGLLPAAHSHTLQQLVSNKGCVRHYADDSDPEQAGEAATDELLQETQYGSALEPAQLIWNDPLVAGCAMGETNYSTHGYTILGAALESAGGMLLPDLIDQALVDPYDLGTLRPEDITDNSVRRSKIYGKSGTEASPDNNTWSILGAGMESSVADLASFGRKLLAGEILSPLATQCLWTCTTWNYAYGWNIGSQDDPDGDAHRVVNKTGGQLGSDAYLLMYPDDDIVIAVLANQQGRGSDDPVSAGHDTKDIGDYIADQMLATL